MQNFRLLTAQVKFHQICTLKVYKVSAKKGGKVVFHDTKESKCAPPPFCRGVQPLTKFLKKGGGGLDGTSAFRGELLGKRGITFFREGGWL